MLKLGKDILSLITFKLNEKDFLNLSMVNKEMHKKDELFKYYLLNKYPRADILSYKPEEIQTWKGYFVYFNYYKEIYDTVADKKYRYVFGDIKVLVDDIRVQLDSMLLLGIDKNSLITVKHFINKGADVNCLRGLPMQRAILSPANSENLKIIEALVKGGVDVNSNNENLRLAVKANRIDAVKYFVRVGVRMNNPRALIEALENKNWEIIKYLVEHGIGVEKTIKFLERFVDSRFANSKDEKYKKMIIYLKCLLNDLNDLNEKEKKDIQYEVDYL